MGVCEVRGCLFWGGVLVLQGDPLLFGGSMLGALYYRKPPNDSQTAGNVEIAGTMLVMIARR